MKNKKAFTLVELLAVIVVLIVILAITIPVVINIIDSTKKAAFKSDARMVLDQVKIELAQNEEFDPTIISYETLPNYNLSGDNYESLTISIVDGKAYIYIIGKDKWNGYKACGTYQNMNVYKTTEMGVCVGETPATIDAEILIVAGGGGGGGEIGGGGGGGGIVYDDSHIITLSSYNIVVGIGGGGVAGVGSASIDNRGINGSNSSFDGLVAIGGGGGGGNNTNGYAAGKNGGSGGGEAQGGYGVGTGTSGQGSSGGYANNGSSAYGSGGGGGFSSVGGAGSNTYGGGGGTGFNSDISGVSVSYGGGGGGAVFNGTVGAGSGGGGNGAQIGGTNATPGIANTGGGGGGNNQVSANGSGGSGVVIIKYLTSAIPYSYGGIKTTDGLYTVHKFTENSVFVASSTPIIGVKALIVGGGGGGGSRNGGGGGAGAYIYKEFIPVSKTQYNIVVGLGGTGVINGSMDYLNSALSGEDSSAFGFTAIGGGAGRGNVAGLIGGSGGGGGGLDNIGGTGTNGNSGGRGYSGNAWSGGGGGGSSGAGGNASANIGGIGGVGTPNNISGSLVTYSTGGIGGAYYGNVVGINGAYNTGNGGGGGGGEPNASGSGGSGIVIIKYLKSSITATSTNAIETTSTDGLYTILTYNQSGTFVVQ